MKVSRNSSFGTVALTFASIISTGASAAQPVQNPSGSAEEKAQARVSGGGTPAAETTLEEIIVTAQKRSESIQDTPLAVSAFSAADLKLRSVTTLSDLAQNVPGFNFTEQQGAARITIRGIGIDGFSSGTESAATFNVDGIVYARHAAGLAGLYDLDRVEVLRGPQGTLYGRNSTSGAINLLTKGPTDNFEGFGSLTVGNFGTINSEGAIGGPLSENVSARFSFNTQKHEGYGDNLVTGNDIDSRDSQAVRGQIRFKPSSELSILLAGDYYQGKDRSGGFHVTGPASEIAPGVPSPITGLSFPGAGIPANLHDTSSGIDPRLKGTFYGGHVDVSYTPNEILTFRSLSAVRIARESQTYDLAPVGPTALIFIDRYQNSKQYTQEFQLNIDTAANKFVTGAFYLNERLTAEQDAVFNAKLFGGPDLFLQGLQLVGRLTTNVAAIYAQDNYSILDSLRITAGGRYSWERKNIDDQNSFDLGTPWVRNRPTFVPHRTDSESWGSFTPKVGLEWDAAPHTMIYTSFSKGFKAGNYNFGNPNPPVSPEKVDAYEAGIKSTVFEGRLRANIAGFYYDYTDLQVFKTRGTDLIEENAASAKIYGIDGEFQLKPFADDPFLVSLSSEWLHARFAQYLSDDPQRPGQGDTIDPDTGLPVFNLHGKTLTQAPDYLVNLAVQETFHAGSWSITPRLESVWTGRIYFSQFNTLPLSQAPFNMMNAFLSFNSANDRYFVNTYVKNLGNKTVIDSGYGASMLVGGPGIVHIKAPRTFGATFGVRF